MSKTTTTAFFASFPEKKKRGRVCEAPFQSLRFAHTGNVLSCCYNRGHVLGKYPDDSLYDIWFGKRLKKLRQALKNNDFRLGCESCLTNIEGGNFYSSGLHQYDYLHTSANTKYPVMLDFEIGNTCNLECVMCNGEYSSTIRKNREKRPAYGPIFDERFVQELEEFIPHLKETRFVGGEPFLVEIHYAIWDRIIKLNPKCKITILTNGTIWNNRIESLFRNGNVHISFSIDSINEADYSQIRKRGRLSNVLSTFEKVFGSSYSPKKGVFINICLMRQNIRSIRETIEYFDAAGCELSFHEVQYPFHSSLWNWDKENLEMLISEIKKIHLKSSSSSEINMKKLTSIGNRLSQLSAACGVISGKRSELMKNDLTPLTETFRQQLIAFSSDTKILTAKLETLLSSLPTHVDQALLKNILVEMMLLPPQMLVAEVESISDERLLMKFKHAFG